MHVPLPLALQLIVPPTPYVNQTAVNQHMGTQPAPIPPRMSTGPTNLQPPAKTLSSQVPSNIQPQQLPFVDALPVPTQDYSVNNTASPSLHDTRSKSTNRQVLSKLHQHPPPPLHQWKSQDLFVGTVEKQSI